MTVNELIAQKVEIERQIAEKSRNERAAVVEQIRGLMSTHGLTPADIVTRKPEKSKRVVAPKYRDENGNTWTGRGLKPKWLANAISSGKTLEQFAI